MKYFFFDIDGTLVVHTMGTAGKFGSYVPESTVEALRLLREKGHFTAIATGRSRAMAQQYFDELGFTSMVHDGGNGLTVEGRFLGIEPLPKDLCVELSHECEEKGFAWAVQPDDGMMRIAPDERFGEVAKDSYMDTRVVPSITVEGCEKIFKMYIACTEEEEKELPAFSKLPHIRYHKSYTFIEPTDKSRGIRRMVEMLGGDVSDIVVFGDGGNDLSMFCDEWTGIAMGNAVPELKAKADYVTDACDKDGIFNACRHFGWI